MINVRILNMLPTAPFWHAPPGACVLIAHHLFTAAYSKPDHHSAFALANAAATFVTAECEACWRDIFGLLHLHQLALQHHNLLLLLLD